MKKRKRVISKKISVPKMGAKSHTINCKECGTPTVCSAQAEWVICPMCVATKIVYIQVRKAANPKRKRKVKVKKTTKKKGKK